MEIGSIIDILRSLPESADLKPGDLLNVKVLEVLENRRALVDAGRFRTMAEITFPVAAGDELRVRVRETQGRLSLQLVPTPAEPAISAARTEGSVQAAALASLRQMRMQIDQLADAVQPQPDSEKLAPIPPGLRQIVDALRDFLEPFEPGLSTEAFARRLKDFCERSGLFLEHRLAAALPKTVEGVGKTPAERILATDLKARLAILKGFFESESGRNLIHVSRDFAGLAKATRELLADIRAGQEQLAQSAAESRRFQVMHFALPMPGERCRAELKIGYGRKSASGNTSRKDGHRAAILLEFDRMGAVRADLVLQSRRLDVTVFVDDTGMRDLVTRHADEVHEALAPFFELVTLQVSVAPRRIAGFSSEDWGPAGETLVDVRV